MILTDAGDRLVQLFATDRTDTIEASVDMGEIRPGSEPEGWAGIGCHPDRPVLHLNTGNPHTVVGVDEVAVVDLQALGEQVPGTNLEIVEPGTEPDVIRMRVHERGAGVTQACGTGACASAFAARAWGMVPATAAEIVVQMDGGRAKVRLDDPAPGRATLVGPSVLIGRIEVEIEHHLASAGSPHGVATTHEGNTTSA
jgi:diaminopimelate epimerase